MIIIKRLIVKNWLKAFSFSFLTLFLLVSLADLISGFLRVTVTPQQVLQNYLYNLPFIFSKLTPLACLMATLFSLNKLKNDNELTSLLSAGFSSFRVIKIIFFLSLFIAFFQILNTSWLEPYVKKLRLKNIPQSVQKFSQNKSKGLKTSILKSGRIWYKSNNYFVSFKAYDKKFHEIKQPTLYFFNKAFKPTIFLRAEKAIFKNGKWHLINGYSLTSLNGRTFPDKKEFLKEEIPLKEIPENFSQIDSDITTLNIISLNYFIKNLETSGINTDEYQILFYQKISWGLVCLVFALFPLAPLFNPNRRQSSTGKNIVFILIFTIIYWLLESTLHTMGAASKVSPFLATFFVPIIIGFYSLFAIFRGQRL